MQHVGLKRQLSSSFEASGLGSSIFVSSGCGSSGLISSGLDLSGFSFVPIGVPVPFGADLSITSCRIYFACYGISYFTEDGS